MDLGGKTITLAEARDAFAGLCGLDVGEFDSFLVITHHEDQGVMVFGYPNCGPCRVSFLAHALDAMSGDLPHDGGLHQ